jgi:TolB-like protein
MRLSGILAAIMLVAFGSVVLAQEAKPAKVLVLPFESIGPEPKDWIARALEQNLMAELARVPSVEPVAGTTSAGDQEAALKAATAAGAKFVVFGSYQAVDSDLRMTGQVIDVETKQALAGLKATGTLRDLFGLEDTIASQVKKSLPQAQPGAGAGAGAAAKAPDMLEHPKPAAGAGAPPAPPAAPVPPPAIAPRGPIEIARAADDLVDEMDRAIERIRYRNTYEEDIYYNRRPYYGGYNYGYPVYYYPGNVFIPSGGGIIGQARPSRDAGHTEHGIPRLSFPNFVPEQRRVRR